MRRPALTALLGILAFPAYAGIEICNASSTRQSVAIGYEGDTGAWTSEGWWRIEPGACATVRAAPLDRPVFYYRATVPGAAFDGPYAFCTQAEPFTIVGDTDCEARGYARTRFREVALDHARDFTLTLVDPGAADTTAPPRSAAPWRVTSDYQRGTLGEPVSNAGIFTGCRQIDGLEYCEIVADGWRWHAYTGGGTPDAVIDALFGFPENLPVRFTGDVIGYGDITVETVLAEVAEDPEGDPHAALRTHLQGEWVSLDDARARFRVSGADVYDYYDGVFMDHHLMTFRDSCDGAPEGTGWVRTPLDTQEGWCMLISAPDAATIELVNPGRGNILRYQRTN